MTERIGQRTIVAIVASLIAVVMLGGIIAVFADDDPLPAAGARLQVDGSGRVVTDGGDRVLHDGDVLRPGAEVEVEEGTAVLELAGGGTLEIRAGRDRSDGTRLEVGAPSRLLAGDVLAVGPAGVAVEAAGTLVTLRGADNAVRIRRELAVTSATYQGTASVDSAGQGRDVPAYRQLGVASVGRTDPDPEPLVVDAADPWDQRYLGVAISLTRSLDSFSQTFTAQGGARTTASELEDLLPRLADQAGFGPALLDADRDDGETLVGAAIAAAGSRGAFDDRWEQVFEFHDDGAEWGLVALDQGVADGPVLSDVEAALSRSVQPTGAEVAVGPPATTPPATTPATTPPATAPSTTTASTPPPTTPTTEPSTPTTLLPDVPAVPVDPDVPLPDAGDDLLQGLLQPVTDLLGGLLGG